jgi:mRNA-degrading endonuclease RelE of RelBE toxin-antitoxin system
MIYKVVLSPTFIKEAKRLIKKYPSLKVELKLFGEDLSQNPNQGIALGNDVYKTRLSIASKNKGKSGGARIIYFVKISNIEIILLTIYNKGEKDTISDEEIKSILQGFL